MNGQHVSPPFQTYQPLEPPIASSPANQGLPESVLRLNAVDSFAGHRKLLMTVNEAAQRLSIGRPKMWQLVMTGEVLSIKIGASRRIPVTALESYVQRLCVEAEQDLQRRYQDGTSWEK